MRLNCVFIFHRMCMWKCFFIPPASAAPTRLVICTQLGSRLPMVWPGVDRGVTDPSGDGWNCCWTLVRIILAKWTTDTDQSIPLPERGDFTPPARRALGRSKRRARLRPLTPVHVQVRRRLPACILVFGPLSQIANLRALGAISPLLCEAEWGRRPPEIVDSI